MVVAVEGNQRDWPREWEVVWDGLGLVRGGGPRLRLGLSGPGGRAARRRRRGCRRRSRARGAGYPSIRTGGARYPGRSSCSSASQ